MQSNSNNSSNINADSDIIIHDDDPIQVMTIKQKIKKIHKSKKKVQWNYKNIEPLDVLANNPDTPDGVKEGFQEGLSMDNTTCEDDNDYMGCDNTKKGKTKLQQLAGKIEEFFENMNKAFHYIALAVSLIAIYWTDNSSSKDRGSKFQYDNRDQRRKYERELGFAINPRIVLPKENEVKRVKVYVELFFSAAVSAYFVYNWFFLLIYEDELHFENGVNFPNIYIDNAEKQMFVSLTNEMSGGITIEGLLHPFLNKKTVSSVVQFVDSKTGVDPLEQNSTNKKSSSAFYFIFLTFFKYSWVFITIPHYLLFVQLRKFCKQREFKFLNDTISIPNYFTRQLGFIVVYITCIVLTFYSSATLKDFIVNTLKGDFLKSPALITIASITTLYFMYSLFSIYNPVRYLFLIPFFGIALIFLLYVIIMLYSPFLAAVLLFIFFFSHSLFGGLIYGGRYVFKIPELIDDYTRLREPVPNPDSYFDIIIYPLKLIMKVLFANLFYIVLFMIMLAALVDYFINIKNTALKYGMILVTIAAIVLLYFVKFMVDKIIAKRVKDKDHPYVSRSTVTEALNSALSHEST